MLYEYAFDSIEKVLEECGAKFDLVNRERIKSEHFHTRILQEIKLCQSVHTQEVKKIVEERFPGIKCRTSTSTKYEE